MSAWSKLMGNIFRNPKFASVDQLPQLLYLAGLAWCGDQRTGGRIVAGAVRLVCADARVDVSLVNDLVAAGLWEEHPGGGYQVHDWHVYNPTADDWEAKSEAGKRAAQARWNGTHATGNAERMQDASDAHATGNATNTSTITNYDHENDLRNDDDRARASKPAIIAAFEAAFPDSLTRKKALALEALDRRCIEAGRPALLQAVIAAVADNDPGEPVSYVRRVTERHLADGTDPSPPPAAKRNGAGRAPPAGSFTGRFAPTAADWTEEQWAAHMAERAGPPEEPPPETEAESESYEAFLARRREHDRAVATAAPPGRGREPES